jgi:hypothetical protein
MWGELLIDETGTPSVYETRIEAHRARVDDCPSYYMGIAIVEVEIHEGSEEPTYVIGDVVS